MMYRILEVKQINNETLYKIERKFLCFWIDGNICSSKITDCWYKELEEAGDVLNKVKNKQALESRKVVSTYSI